MSTTEELDWALEMDAEDYLGSADWDEANLEDWERLEDLAVPGGDGMDSWED